MTAKKYIWLAVVAAILLGLIVWIAWGDSALECNSYTVSSSQLPKSFDGYRIAQISDLHNTEIGKDNERLLAMLRGAEPDMIAITGDLIDSRRTNVEIALKFIREAVKIAPCYYVTGNHESRVTEYSELKAGMEAAGVVILEDAQTEIRLGEDAIAVIGVNDPDFKTDKLAQLQVEEAGFTVLLSHRPELFDAYVEKNVDLALSGHSHGGQIRLPFLGGLIAPHQGLFPKYDGGLYTKDDTNMVVSRGVGNSLFPFRVNNRPEIVLVELRGEEND